MTRVLHVIDRTCNETHLQVLQTLRRRMDSTGTPHTICSLDPAMTRRAERHLDEPVQPAHRRLPALLNWVPGLGRAQHAAGAELVHAWGIEAAAACSARLAPLPLVVTLLDPDSARETATWLRSFHRQATVVAGSQVIRSRLVTAGVAPERVVVIRGPADFGAINRARRADLRRTVVGDARPVLLMNGPASRGGGQFQALWGAAILQKLYRDLTVILPYAAPERERLVRFVGAIGETNMLTLPDPRRTWPELAACADVFLIPAVDEVCTEPLGAAMAAGLVVVGTAVRSVAEIIADRHNGLLCKSAEPREVASRILTAIEDEPLRRQVTEAARGQAYEVFGVRDFADNYRRLYENVLSGRSAGENVRDTAMAA